MNALDPDKMAVLLRLLHLVESTETPGEVEPVFIELLKLARDPEALPDVQQLSAFARACRTCRKIWLLLIGLVMAVSSIIMYGKNLLIWLRDFLNHIPLDQRS